MSTDATHDLETETETGTESEYSEHDETEEEGSETGAAEGATKKKKKKKKKKKSGPASVASDSGSPTSAPTASATAGTQPQASKKQLAKKFQAALDSLRSGDDMWVQLADSGVDDTKAKRLMEALKGSTSVTSVDLTGNQIKDEGIKAIADALSAGGAPELISLDLRGNELSDDAQQMLEQLQRQRKLLKVEIGTLPAQGSAAGSSGQQELQQGPMFKRFFQAGNDDAEEEATPSSADAQNDAWLAPEELWPKLPEVLAEGSAQIPFLSEIMWAVASFMRKEVARLGELPFKKSTDKFPPHLRHAASNLPLLDQVLQLEPPPVTTQYSDKPQPAAGSHRLWAADIVAQLASLRNTAVTGARAETSLVPRVLALALRHDKCSALHARALQLVQTAVAHRLTGIWQPLFEPGFGCGLTAAGGELMRPLHLELVQFGAAAAGQAVGSRSGLVGLVVQMLRDLQQACAEEPKGSYNKRLHELLKEDEEWVASTSVDGPLHSLLEEQRGDLCGPRPERGPASEAGDGELSGLGGLGNNPELLQLMQSLVGQRIFG